VEATAKGYPIVIFYSQADQGFIADIPDLKYCSAFGNTPQKALEEVLIARQIWIESVIEDGMTLPEQTFFNEHIFGKPQTASFST